MVCRDDPDHSAALHTALDVSLPGSTPQPDPRVAELLTDSGERGLSIDLFVGAFRGTECVSAALAVESPGRAALVFVPERQDSDRRSEATTACLRVAQRAAWERSIILLELLLPLDAPRLARVVQEAGFRHLTRLLYLRRNADLPIPPTDPRNDPEWVTYTPSRANLFAEAIALSYSQSLDCPELTGLRSMPDVLAGHRAAGVFDPTLWSVALRDGEPIAVLLLSRLARPESVEIVYMGVAQVARGTGVANAVMRRAVSAGRRLSATLLALAVDQRNQPARRVYTRWGFEEFAARAAWIATLPPTEG